MDERSAPERSPIYTDRGCLLKVYSSGGWQGQSIAAFGKACAAQDERQQATGFQDFTFEGRFDGGYGLETVENSDFADANANGRTRAHLLGRGVDLHDVAGPEVEILRPTMRRHTQRQNPPSRSGSNGEAL